MFSIRNLIHSLTGEFCLVGRVFLLLFVFSKRLSSQSFLVIGDFQTPNPGPQSLCSVTTLCIRCLNMFERFLNPPTRLILRMHQWGRTSCFLLMENEFRVNSSEGNRSYLFTAHHWLCTIWEMGWWRINVLRVPGVPLFRSDLSCIFSI